MYTLKKKKKFSNYKNNDKFYEHFVPSVIFKNSDQFIFETCGKRDIK